MNSSDEYSVVGYPAPLTFIEQLMEQFSGSKTEDEISVWLNYEPGKYYARLPYNYVIR